MNKAISTHINAALNLRLQGMYRYGNWGILAGVGLNHLSNGAYQMPNVGINLGTVFAGLNYAFGKKEFVKMQIGEKPNDSDPAEKRFGPGWCKRV